MLKEAKGGLILVLCLACFIPLTSAVSPFVATAIFNSSGVMGNITFTQEMYGAPTTISAYLTGLVNIAGSNSFPWHVHDYPFPHDGNPMPCGNPIVGGHYDPFNVGTAPNYNTLCNQQARQQCEVGDLSGKFGNFPSAASIRETYTDQYLDLYGVYSILGRSIVIHFENGSRFVCANIRENTYMNEEATQTNVVYSPFRNEFVGNIYFRQHVRNVSVYTDLVRIVGDENSNGHNWHVHETRLDVAGNDCSVAGPHYNPRNVNVSEAAGYNVRCGSSNATAQRYCEIGDLSNKGAPFDINSGVVKQLYTDTDLPLFTSSEGFYINNRSIVIHTANRTGPRLVCANTTTFQPLEAVARFSENGVTGSIRFFQLSPFHPTQVFVYLNGLRSIAAGYHVHAYTVGPGTSPVRCSNRYAGGHWNPLNVVDFGTTSDQFEIGDLSSKFGSLAGQNNFYGEYSDPNIPLFGQYSIIGRSIVIHEDDEDGTRWICSNIERIARTVEVRVPIGTSTSEISGTVTLSQPADDPYSETTIVVELNVNQALPYTANGDGMVEFDWSLRRAASSSVSNCGALSLLRVYESNAMVCSSTQQLACEVGDLSSKHGRLLIPNAAGSVFRAVYTDANLPLAGRPGLDSVFGGDSRTGYLYLVPTQGGSSGICAQSNAATIVEAPPTDATPTDGASPITRVSSVLLSMCLLFVAVLALSW